MLFRGCLRRLPPVASRMVYRKNLHASIAVRNSENVVINKRQVTVDRELPDPFAARRQEKRYFWAYAVGVTVSLAIIFNYEKTRSPIINSSLYFLRRSAISKSILGDDINFKSSWPWIWGPLNTAKGNIDISFDVSGSKGTATLKLKAKRENKLHPFNVEHFLLEINGETYDLRRDPNIDFDI